MSTTNGAPHEGTFEEDARGNKRAAIDDDDDATPAIELPSRKEIDAAMDKAKRTIAPLLEMTFLGVSLWATGKFAWEQAKRKAAKRAKGGK